MMPLSRRLAAWLVSLTMLMNLSVVPLSQALTTREHAPLLPGDFCSTSSDSSLHLKLNAVFKDIDLPDDHESPAPHLYCCISAAGTPGLVVSWSVLSLAPLVSPACSAFSATDLPPLYYWRLVNPRVSPITRLLPRAFDNLNLRVEVDRGAIPQLPPWSRRPDGKRPVIRYQRVTMRTSFFAATAPLAVSAFTQIHECSAGQLHIEHPWALALPLISPSGAVYFVVQNHGKENGALLDVDTPCTASAGMYEHTYKNDMMSIQKIGSADVASGKDLRFAPGDYHLMLMGLEQPLVAGERFPLMLHFRKADDVSVEIVVEPKTPAEQGEYEQYGH